MTIAVYIVLLVILVMLLALTYNFPLLTKKQEEKDDASAEQKFSLFQGFIWNTTYRRAA